MKNDREPDSFVFAKKPWEDYPSTGRSHMASEPLVTIMIATRDRHEDLDYTLRDLRRQDYSQLEMIVIDDGSKPPIKSIVLQHWQTARVIRHDVNRGQSLRRNEGIQLAKGKYILHLDDDCSPIAVDAISRSVVYMEATPRCAGIAYYEWNGHGMPDQVDACSTTDGNCLSYIGAAAFLRKSALEQTEGYRELYVAYGEETELSLQLLKRGWNLSFQSRLKAHHRYSSRNRSKPTVWKSSLRNNLWTIFIHLPWRRVPVEVGWKLIIGAWDALRLRRGRLFCEAIAETIHGLRVILKSRNVMDPATLRRFDALRAYGILPYRMFENPPDQRWANLKRWAKRWLKCRGRALEGSFYQS